MRQRYPLTLEQIAGYMASLQVIAEVVEGRVQVYGASKDPDDNHVLACAVEGAVDFVVSDDRKHILTLAGVSRYPDRLDASVLANAALALRSPPGWPRGCAATSPHFVGRGDRARSARPHTSPRSAGSPSATSRVTAPTGRALRGRTPRPANEVSGERSPA